MTEAAARAFFDLLGLHATNVLRDLPQYLPLLQRHPAVVRAGIGGFAGYFKPGLRSNVPAASKSCFT